MLNIFNISNNIYAYPNIFCVLFLISLGLFAFLSKRTKTNFLFALLTLSAAIWQLGTALTMMSSEPNVAFFWTKFSYIGVTLIPITMLHFVINYLNIQKARIFIPISYGLGLIVFIPLTWMNVFLDGVYHFTWGYWFKATPIHPLYVLSYSCLFFVNLFLLYIAYMKQINIERERIRYLLFALFVSYGGAIDYLPDYGFNIYPNGYIFAVICLSIIAYAILRHRLMDIEIIIKKGFIYSILMAAIIGIYSSLMFIGQNIFQTAFGINQWVATIITAFLIAVGYKPLESFLTDFTDQYFFRKKYDYQKTLKDSSEAMNLLTDIDRLVKLTTRIVARRMELVETSTLIFEEPHHRYIVKAAEGKSKELLGTTFSDNFELFKHLFSSKNILVKDEVIQTLNSKLVLSDERKRLNTIKKEMEKLHAQLCIPSITRGKYMGNKLVAIFCMGEKKSGDMYSNEDIQLLTTLSNQAAVAIENALMYSDLMNQYKELKETKDQLVQSEKLAALGTMAAGIAHEIRNPLTSLQLFVQMMAERFDDHEFREKFTQIVPPEIERLNRIVNDLVSFAKPAKLTREPNQINEILEKTVRLSEISFKKLNVKVVKEFSDVPKVMADPQQIMQIFLNLIMNGAQAMPNGGTLTVKSYFNTVTGRVAIDINDTGTGISEENIKKLFSPFFTTKDGGTGLGLAITRRIIEEHKGEIKVKSRVGEGTTFTVELPVAA